MRNPGLPSDEFRLAVNRSAGDWHSYLNAAHELLPMTDTAFARMEIRSWPGYESTPLVELPGLARAARVGRIWYKDEGSRFGVGSFKPLGGGYAVSRIVNRDVARMPGSTRPRVTVTCATDGNHGRAVAWAANRFGCDAVVYMASLVSPLREKAIASFGATTVRSSGTHEDAARECRYAARQNGWYVVSETETASEPQIALDTLAGYTTLLDEICSQLPDQPPTHMFVQAGVGGLAGAAAAFMTERWRAMRPALIVVEALNADCISRSLERGEPVAVGGELSTIMAGLAAGEVSGYAWKLLHHGADFAMAIGDDAPVSTMRILADAPHGDEPVVGGESGVAGLAAALIAGQDQATRDKLRLNGDSRLLTIGTEGATDPTIYERLVGRHPADVIPEGAS